MNEQVKSRKASASLSKRRRDRLQKLYEEQTLSLDLREEVETEAELAQLELAQARADKRVAALQLDRAIAVLKRRTIRSPISGVVVDRMMSPGERVDEEPILKVAQIDPLRVEVILPSSMFGSVTVGMRAAVVPEFPGDKVHVASVAIVDRVIDAASGTFGVRLALPNPHHEIPGGLHCQVRFLSE
jgi:multidrug efflux pump subunit AcrA (membrane-fusion protein)